MKTELRVGQVWIGNGTKLEKEILAIGKSSVFFRAISTGKEEAYSLTTFHDDHTIQQPKTTLLGFITDNGMFIEYEKEWYEKEMTSAAKKSMRKVSERKI